MFKFIMEKSFVKPDGFRHGIVKFFLPLFDELEALVGPEKVSTSRYREVRHGKNFVYNIREYDNLNKSIRMQVKYCSWMQEFVFVVAPEEVDKIKDFMSTYSIE